MGQRVPGLWFLRPAVRLSWVVCAVCSATSPAQAQQTAAGITRVDAYGNARPIYNPRRSVGSFASEAQRQQARGFQLRGRREYQRGGEVPFAIAADRALRSYSRASSFRPSLPATNADTKRAFTLYGLDGNRPRYEVPLNLDILLSRRTDMLRATSSSGPIRKSLAVYGPPPLMPPDDDTVPIAAEFPQVQSASLAESLRSRLDATTARLAEEAWSQFEAGSYRRALRAFESLAAVDAENLQARVAAVFCRASIGSMRAAATSVDHLVRGASGVFAEPLDCSGLYADDRLRSLRVQWRLYSQANQAVARSAALHAFLLWFSGDRQSALSVATVVARDFPNSPFAAWPELMRNAPAPADRDLE